MQAMTTTRSARTLRPSACAHSPTASPSSTKAQPGDHEPVNCTTVTLHLPSPIDRFRGINALKWSPAQGVNIILGGGDVGKTTILDAIAFLLSPTNSTTLSDTDYYACNIAAGFSIEAIVALPPESGISEQSKLVWPWVWNGSDAIVPSTDTDASSENGHGPVYKLRVRGTSDLELAYEILQPDGGTDVFSAGLRRSIGIARLGGDDRNDRDLRLVQGSALDRLLSDQGLRSRAKENPPVKTPQRQDSGTARPGRRDA